MNLWDQYYIANDSGSKNPLDKEMRYSRDLYEQYYRNMRDAKKRRE